MPNHISIFETQTSTICGLIEMEEADGRCCPFQLQGSSTSEGLIPSFLDVRPCILMPMYICIHIPIFLHTYVYMYVCIYVYIYIHSARLCMYVYNRSCLCKNLSFCIYICIYVCVLCTVHIYVYKYTYTCSMFSLLFSLSLSTYRSIYLPI